MKEAFFEELLKAVEENEDDVEVFKPLTAKPVEELFGDELFASLLVEFGLSLAVKRLLAKKMFASDEARIIFGIEMEKDDE